MTLINILRLETPLKLLKWYVKIQDGYHVVGQITLKQFKKIFTMLILA